MFDVAGGAPATLQMLPPFRIGRPRPANAGIVVCVSPPPRSTVRTQQSQ
jgi:hypothetical protein